MSGFAGHKNTQTPREMTARKIENFINALLSQWLADERYCAKITTFANTLKLDENRSNKNWHINIEVAIGFQL